MRRDVKVWSWVWAPDSCGSRDITRQYIKITITILHKELLRMICWFSIRSDSASIPGLDILQSSRVATAATDPVHGFTGFQPFPFDTALHSYRKWSVYRCWLIYHDLPIEKRGQKLRHQQLKWWEHSWMNRLVSMWKVPNPNFGADPSSLIPQVDAQSSHLWPWSWPRHLGAITVDKIISWDHARGVLNKIAIFLGSGWKWDGSGMILDNFRWFSLISDFRFGCNECRGSKRFFSGG